jgi:spore maturation protein CgeB
VVEPGPGFSVQDVAVGWADGLKQNGCEVITFNLCDRLSFFSQAEIQGKKAFNEHEAVRLAVKGLEDACYEAWPDIVLIVSGFFIEAQLIGLMRARGHKVVLVHTESPYEDEKQLERAGLVDLNLLNDPTNLAKFQAINPNSFYNPHAYDPLRHRPKPPNPEHLSDFALAGTGYPSRVDFLEAVDWGDIDVALAGNWQQLAEDSRLRKYLAHDIDACCPNDEAVDLYVATKMSANIYRKEGLGDHVPAWALGPREVELAACGTPFLREPGGEGDELLPMLPTFDGPGDFGEKLRWWLAHPDERLRIAAEARAALADRTFQKHAANLLRMLDL